MAEMPIGDMGKPITPRSIVAALTWLGALTPDEIVAAIQHGPDDAEARWPELTKAEIAEMRRQCAGMTKSRLRAWKGDARGSAKPTWLEMRALISGLHSVIE